MQLLRHAVLFTTLLAAKAALATPSLLAQTAPPNLLHLQARLADSGGNALAGPVTVEVRVYALPSGGAPLWSEVHSATALNGVVNLVLGSIDVLPSSLFDDGTRWLALKVGADAEMTPRRAIASVPFARRAATAAALDTNATLPAGLVASAHLVDGTVATADLANGAVTSAKLAGSSVGTAALADGGIQTADLGLLSVVNSRIADDAVDGAKILDGSVTGFDLAEGSVASTHLAGASVESAAIADGSVQTIDLANGVVTSAKLASGSVGSAAVIDGAIQTADLALSAVVGSRIAPDAVDGSKILDGSIGVADLESPLISTGSVPAVWVSHSGSDASSGAIRAELGPSSFGHGIVSEMQGSNVAALLGRATASSGAADGGWLETHSTSGYALWARSFASTGGTRAVRASVESTIGVAVEASANATTGLTIGVRGGCSSTTGTGVRGNQLSSTGPGFGVYGSSSSNSGTGVFGLASTTTGSTTGVGGEVASSGGIAVEGRATASTGSTIGVYGSSASSSGRGMFGYAYGSSGATEGVHGESNSPIGLGVKGHATSFAGSTNYGVWGEADSTAGYGVYGRAPNIAVYGLGEGTGTRRGVMGEVTSNGGTRGVYGRATATTGIADGVVGETSSSSGFAVWSLGTLSVAGMKNFTQPHPSDPSREVRFVCLEGNESGTYFRGSAALSGGLAVLPVPQEFRDVSEATGLTVQVTPRGPASLWCESVDPQHVVVRGTADVAFDYFVNGVRRGFAEYQPYHDNRSFVPEVRGVPFGTQYPEALRRILVENGTLHPDFTPNEDTAVRMGWALRDPRNPAETESAPLPDLEAIESRRVHPEPPRNERDGAK